MIALESRQGLRQVWSFRDDDKDVATLSAIPVKLKALNQTLKGGWAVDFNTQESYRRRGLGSRLVEEANKSFDVFLAVGASDMSFKLFNKMGWVYCGDIPHYIMVFEPTDLFASRIKNPFLAGTLALAAALFIKVSGLFHNRRFPRKIKLSVIERFGAEADLLWEKVKGSYDFAVVRDSSFLINRYDTLNDPSYIRLRAEKNDDLTGYAVLRIIDKLGGKPQGLITDIIASADDKDVIRALLLKVVECLKSKGCSLLRCYFSGPVLCRALLSAGFLRRKSWMRLMIKDNNGVLNGICNQDGWYLSAADSDIDRGE